MTDKYTTNHNYRVEATPNYGAFPGITINLALFRPRKTAVFHYNRLGALEAIRSYLIGELNLSDYCRADTTDIRVYNHNRRVVTLRINGNGDEFFVDALDEAEKSLRIGEKQ